MTVRECQVGETRFEKAEIDAATVASQPALIEQLAARTDPDLVLDVRLAGVRRDDLDLDLVEIETALAPHFLKIRVRDRLRSRPDRRSAPVARHDRRRVHPRPRGAHRRARSRRLDRRGRRAARRPSPRAAAPRRTRGLPVRVRKLSGTGLPALSRVRHRLRPGRDRHPRPQRGRQDDDPASARARPDPPSDEHRGGGRSTPAVGSAAGGPLGHHRRVRAGRRGRPEGRHAREDLRREQGDGPPRLRGPVDHRPEPRRPGHGRADRDPDRGLLPVDRLGPPFRAERPVARRGRAARPSPGLDQRRRPRHEPGAQEARPGAPRPEHPR